MKENYDNLYKMWRWLTYNQLDRYTIKQISSDNTTNNQHFKFSNYNGNYTSENLRNFKIKNFSVSNELIKNYNSNLIEEVKLSNKNFYTTDITNYPRAEFIEGCFIKTSHFSYEQLKEKIKRNIILYYWWDIFSFNELGESIIALHFLKSTRKLISKNSLSKYFNLRFKVKKDFIKYLHLHFEPPKEMVNEMNSFFRNEVVFDYKWLFYNDLKKSIRIFENECRLFYDEKIIGSFYNENVLFREIKRRYEKDYLVISQGSPEWLGLQRFDIYFPELNIAIEYQGEQHKRPVDFGGKGKKVAKKQFRDNLKRDRVKKSKAEDNECKIFFVYPNYDLKELIKKINSEIKKRRA